MHAYAGTIFSMANSNSDLIGSLKDSWNALSSDQRTIVGVLGALDGVGKAVALWDLSRTDSRKLRGSKLLWTPIIGAVNTFGWLAYFTIGKKH